VVGGIVFANDLAFAGIRSDNADRLNGLDAAQAVNAAATMLNTIAACEAWSLRSWISTPRKCPVSHLTACAPKTSKIDQLPALAADLVRAYAAVILTIGGDPPAFAAKAASQTIPIVFIVGRNPVDLGLVMSLNRPGGNSTGINLLITETESKRIEILRQLVPSASRFAVFINPKNGDAEVQMNMVQLAAKALDQQIEIINASTESEIERAFGILQHDAIAGFIVSADPFFVDRRDQITSAANQNRIPGVYPVREFAEIGGLASYGISLADAYRQAGVYAGKILGGIKPAELPVVQPTKFDLVINLKVAKMLGLTVPPTLLATADEVIE
jgi:putative ABC transport system substrate-binding protein